VLSREEPASEVETEEKPDNTAESPEVEQLELELFQDTDPNQFFEFDFLNKFLESFEQRSFEAVDNKVDLLIPGGNCPPWSFIDTFGVESQSRVWK